MSLSPEREKILLEELRDRYKRSVRDFALSKVFDPSFADMALLTVMKVDRKTLLVDILREVADGLEQLDNEKVSNG